MENVQVAETAVRNPRYLLPFLIVIVVVSFVNFVMLVALLGRGAAETTAATPQLPTELRSNAAKDALGSFLVEAYNAKELDALYQWLDPLIQVKVSRAEFERQMSSLYSLIPGISDAAYASYECDEAGNSMTSCRLYYIGKTSQGQNVTITVFIQRQGENAYRNYGFTLNLN
ncbi:MAG: hypothetical protein NDJ18_06295 [candidate division Zixibacteria bacterium]|nr:hypothetical protein [candidate division Zixibacteria bacterium]